MKIALDAKRAFNNFTGLGNYSRFIINAVNDYVPDSRLMLFSPQVAQHPESITFYEKYSKQTYLPNGFQSKGIFRNLWRSSTSGKIALEEGAEVFHGLSAELPSKLNNSINKIVTIHDLIFLRYPKLYPFIDRKIYSRKAKYACKKADTIIAISEQTKEDIIDYFSIDPAKIEVVYQGVHPNYLQEVKPQRILYLTEQYGLHQPYFIFVGSIEERKNPDKLVEAFYKVYKESNDDIQLLIVGRRTEFQTIVEKKIEELKLRGIVRIYNKVPFGDLPFLYKGAVASVYPSKFEGFGIPVIESLHMGTAVVAGEGKAMQEAGGNHALYANPEKTDELAGKMQQLLQNPEQVELLLKDIDKHLEQFQDSVIARHLNRIYKA